MSPEQTGQTPIQPDSRADIYSLGILLWGVLVQEAPFLREDPHGNHQSGAGRGTSSRIELAAGCSGHHRASDRQSNCDECLGAVPFR